MASHLFSIFCNTFSQRYSQIPSVCIFFPHSLSFFNAQTFSFKLASELWASQSNVMVSFSSFQWAQNRLRCLGSLSFFKIHSLKSVPYNDPTDFNDTFRYNFTIKSASTFLLKEWSVPDRCWAASVNIDLWWMFKRPLQNRFSFFWQNTLPEITNYKTRFFCKYYIAPNK